MNRLILIFFLLVGYTLAAHPHSFIQNSNKLIIDSKGANQLQAQWIFDEMFTEMIMFDYDLDMNGYFDEKETQMIYDEAFTNTKSFNFFIDLTNNSKKILFDEVSDFTVSLVDEQLIYDFTLEFPEFESAFPQEIIALTYDPTYYIMIETDNKTGFLVSNQNKIRSTIDTYEKSVNFDLYGELPVTAFKIILKADND